MVRLSDEDILFFKREGYLVKRKVLDPDLMARARDRLWDGAPPSMDRYAPETWVGPIKEEEECPDTMNAKRGFRWNFREPGGEDWMVQLLATDPSVWGMAEQFLGEGNLRIPDRIRGIYCTLPYGDEPEKPTTCHVDGHPFHLGVVGYIDHVPPRGGGFTVWPKSHLKFYYEFHSQYKHERTDGYDNVLAAVNQMPYIETHGEPGDIVFWHHRIGHAAGQNFSNQIRQAVLYDFCKTDMEQTQEEPPCADMWRDWPGIQALKDKD